MMAVLISWVSISLILCLALVRAAARRFVHSSAHDVAGVVTSSARGQDTQSELSAESSGRLVTVP
jgi:hypothetical protein